MRPLAKKAMRIQSTLQRYQSELSRLQTYRLWLGLSVFFLLVASQISKGLHLELVALFLALPLFLIFFRKSRQVSCFLTELQLLKNFYEDQQKIQQGQMLNTVPAEDMADVDLARDLDLGYFFAAIDKSFSVQGQRLVNQWLCQVFPYHTRQQRQALIKALTQYPGLLRRLQLQKPLRLIDFARMTTEINRPFFDEKMTWKWLVPISWFLLLTFVIVGLNDILIKSMLLIYMGSVLNFIGRTQHLFSRLQDLHADFAALGERVKTLETLAQRVPDCEALQKGMASGDIRTLNRLISLMSMKSNPILFYILNLIAPWDFLLAELSERARRKFTLDFSAWSSEVVKIEAAACFANLKLYHNTQWAEEGSSFVEVEDLSHPLLNQNTVVTNDFSPGSNQIILITGSNMSGKSTFLRAIGLNFCLANIGAPVFARSFRFKPMALASCIRVSDSLRDGQSYFYAEVQRMKKILQKSKSQDLLFLIDEPLRGTNNRERLIGNQKYLQQILKEKAYGFISTHDLELTALADQSQQIANFHFSEQWDQSDLLFDYKIKTGPSKSTNALKILEREGLIDL